MPRITIFDVTVLESVGTVTIPINRTGGDLSRGSVIRATSRDVSAVGKLTNLINLCSHNAHLVCAAGSDYEALSNFRIRWQANNVNPRYVPNPTTNDPLFEFTILDDDVPEDRVEYFEIDLTLNPTGNNRNGFFFPDAIGRVTILDDDIRKP